MFPRKPTRQIHIGPVAVGGSAPVSVQSMTKTDTRDVRATVRQIKNLEALGCEIIRVAVPDQQAAQAIGRIKKSIKIPLIADIHFDYRLALEAVKQGADGLRLNPGNIGAKTRVEEVVKAARDKKIPIRIGVNSGSIEKEILKKYGHPTPQAAVESAQKHIRILEDLNFDQIKVSLKFSDVAQTVEAYRRMSKTCSYPLHLGVTEAGTVFTGTVKSAAGISILLAEGIGDTIRVSLSGDPREEVRVGWEILKSLGLRRRGVDLVACPTCGRCEIDLSAILAKVEPELAKIEQPLRIAIMGCAVNGPGEAKEADLGIAGGKGVGLLFRRGEVVKKLKEKDLARALLAEVQELLGKKEN